MRKYVPYTIVALVFGLLGFFCRSGSSLSAGQVVSISSSDDLRALRDKKIVALTATFEKMTDPDSARKHLPAAQTTYLELALVNARSNMIARDNSLAASPSTKEQPLADLRAQLERLSKSQEITNELSPAFDSLFALNSIRVVRTPDKTGSLRSTVATLRSQLQAYKKQHDDKYPDLKTFGWSQLTQRTTGNGTIADGALARNHETFGPYLKQLPVNPYTDSSKVTVVNSVGADFKPGKGNGFVFEESTGRIYGVGADGKILDDSAKADIR